MFRPISAAALLLAAAGSAQATWSIILVDTRTGEIAVGSATCLTSFDLRAGTPVLIPGVGAATAQSFVDSSGQNRVLIRDRLAAGVSPQSILAELATFDTGHQTRQYGIVDALGRTATFSGTGAGAWAGGQTGQFTYSHLGNIGTIAYAVQGNVLTGEPVVAAAVQAITTTPGDVAARMMAGMQAARQMGGDGRCSCSSSAPTSCGSPPPSFTKSAHIAYMLIARAGDREGSNGIYRTGVGPTHITVADIAGGDGRPDIITANVNGSNFSIVANTTTPGAVFPTFASLPTNIGTGAAPRGVAAGDVNGDGRVDVLTANSTGGNVSVHLALAAGGFAPPVNVATGAFCRALALANLDGNGSPDLATANLNANTVSVRLNDGAGGFAGGVDVPVDAGPQDVIAGNFVGSAAADLAVICRSANRLVILTGDGAGGFAQHASIATANGPAGVASLDVDNDGDLDIAVACDTALTLQVFRNDAGVFNATNHPAGFSCQDVAAGDVSGDGRPDLVAVGGPRFGVFRNTATAVVGERTYTTAGSLSAGHLADVDLDGDLDLVGANASLGGAMVIKNYGPGAMQGTFNDGVGCGTGDYWMNFNIAFQTQASPDPVLQLQTQYDAWRASLVGRVDAVQSRAYFVPAHLPANGTATSEMTIILRDWNGNAVTAPVANVSVTHAPGSPGLTAIGPVTSLGGGVYRAVITAPAQAPHHALESFRVVADDGQRPVTLMPAPRISLYGNSFYGNITCYPNCDDSNQPPILNVADFTCFLQMYVQGLPYANCDSSTTPPVVNAADFTCFLQRWAAADCQ